MTSATLQELKAQLKPSATYLYYDSFEQLNFIVFRLDSFNKKNGEPTKKCLFYTCCGIQKGVLTFESGESLEMRFGVKERAPYNIINLNLLEMPIGRRIALIVEGEKCVDAVQKKYGDKVWVTTFSGGCSAVEKTDFSILKDTPFDRIYFWPDADAPGLEAVEKFKKQYDGPLYVVNTKSFSKGYDVYDFMIENPHKDIMEHMALNSEISEKINLELSSDGKVICNLSNLSEIFEKDLEWKNVLGFNELSGCVYLLQDNIAGPKGQWKLHHGLRARKWLEKKYPIKFKSILTQNLIEDAIELVGANNSYNPIFDYLENLKWDGEDRFKGSWLVSENPTYTYSVVKYWMWGAVQRGYHPGCKFDESLIFEGDQGQGKGLLLSTLGQDWYADLDLPFGDKEIYNIIRNKWIVEIGELASFGVKQMKKAKQFLTARIDTFRSPYSRKTEDVARRCVFAGTTNDHEYLKDPTGARRFLPIHLTDVVDVEYVRKHVHQLWAQVVSIYRSKKPLFIPDEVHQMRKEKFCDDVWTQKIKSYLGARIKIEISELLSEALYLPIGNQNHAHKLRAGASLRMLGFKNKAIREGEDIKKIWMKE